MKKALRAYQVEDLAYMINNPRVINRSEPATGKTGPACAYLEYVWKYEEGCSIMLQPKSIIRKNYDEILAFTTCFEPEDLFIWDPKKVSKLTRPPKVILTTADSLTRHWGLMKTLTAKPVKLLVGDEWHLYYSTDESKRTQFLYQVMRDIPRLLAMTGTAIRGRMDSAYPIIQLIEPRYYGTYQRFIAEHAVISLWDGSITGWTNHAKLGRILLHHGINRTFAECYGKESKCIIPVHIDMTPQQAKVYQEFHDKAMLELHDEDVLTASSEGVAVIRCRQLLAHPEHMRIADWKPEHNAKDQWLLDEITSQYETGLVFATLKPEQNRIRAVLEREGLRVAMINGDVSMTKRAEIDAKFQRGEIDWIVASPATAGVGFNWQRAAVVVFTSPSYMDDEIVQAYRRAIRGIRETPLPIYLPQYTGTVEDRILEIVEEKSRLAAKVDPTREPLTGLRVP